MKQLIVITILFLQGCHHSASNSGEYMWSQGEPYRRPQNVSDLAHPGNGRKPGHIPVSPIGEGCWFPDNGMPAQSACDVWYRLCMRVEGTYAVCLDPDYPGRARRIVGYELQSLCTDAWVECHRRDARGEIPRWPATLEWDDGSDDVFTHPGPDWIAVVPPVNHTGGVCEP